MQFENTAACGPPCFSPLFTTTPNPATLLLRQFPTTEGEAMEKRIIGIAAGLIKSINHVPRRLASLVDHITFGSYTPEKREGNKEPTYWFDQDARSSINAIGLKNEGLPYFLKHELTQVIGLREQGCKIRVSLAPLKQGDLREMIAQGIVLGLTPENIDELEINAACPNHRDEDNKLHAVLAHDPIALQMLMEESEAYKGPKAIKIAPDMSPKSLGACAFLACEYGFTSIVSANTLLADSVIHGVQRLSVPKGGLAGAALLERAVRQVRELRLILDRIGSNAEIPRIIACGGVMSAHEARQHLAAGADDLVQVATYFHEYGVSGVRDLVVELS